MGDGWRVWIDTGGTFTDCVAVDPGGQTHRVKVLSSSALRGTVAQAAGRQVRVEPGWGPVGKGKERFFDGCSFHPLGSEGEGTEVVGWNGEEGVVSLAEEVAVEAGARFEIRSPEEAPVLAARLVTGTPHGKELPAMALRLATTRGTNALLERRGARVGLFVTRGFADLLEIGTQQRPDLFALEVRKPKPLYERVVEVDERLDADGKVLREPDLEGVGEAGTGLLAEGIDSAAVALLHSYRAPEHERRVAAKLRETGIARVAESAELAPLIKILPRAETAVVEAYLAPVLEDYLDGVAAALPSGEDADGRETSLHVMTSAGGLVRREGFLAKDSLLSGPAGGVAGAARAGRRAGLTKLLGFDMGGTSTDVSRYDGDFEYVFEHRVGDAHLVAPALGLETVAAGGGSVCAFEGGRLKVGPESAGARPGPACYGGGGPLTLTDVNLLLGLLDPERFGIPVAPDAAEAAFARVRRGLADAGEATQRHVLLEGFRAIADERMAEAIRSISVRRGYDPAEYALVAFGGAGGQHACAVARRLGVETVLVPPDAGLLSALGLGHARVERFAQRQVLVPLAELGDAGLGGLLAELGEEAVAAVRRGGGETEGGGGGVEVEVRRRILHLRFTGQESTLAVDLDPAAETSADTVRAAFADAYRDRFGYLPEDRELGLPRLEVESARVVASTRAPAEDLPGRPPQPSTARPAARRRARFAGDFHDAAVFERADLAPGARFTGPALVYEAHGATVVEPGWRGRVDGAGSLVLDAGKAASALGPPSVESEDPSER